MAAKRLAASAVDWAAFVERVHPYQMESFRAFKAKSDGFIAKYVTYTMSLGSLAFALSLSNKNSSGDEIANVNFLTTISHTRRPTSKYRKRDKPTSFNKLDDR